MWVSTSGLGLGQRHTGLLAGVNKVAKYYLRPDTEGALGPSVRTENSLGAPPI